MFRIEKPNGGILCSFLKPCCIFSSDVEILAYTSDFFVFIRFFFEQTFACGVSKDGTLYDDNDSKSSLCFKIRNFVIRQGKLKNNTHCMFDEFSVE